MKARTIIIIIIPALLLVSFCYDCKMRKKIIGHWVCEKYIADFQPGDTIHLVKKKFNDKFYQWGSGISSGFTFSENGDFKEYNNVLCSSESDPVKYYDEKWMYNNDTITITSSYRTIRYAILGNSGDDLKVFSLKLVESKTIN
jgi:hypothetical protein